jgi:hypothetical protein
MKRARLYVGPWSPTRHRLLVTRSLERTPGYRVLPGLRLAANSLKASLHELGSGSPFRSIDTRRLCAASLDAGRLIGYLEALEATDRRLAREVADDLTEVLASLDEVRRQFDGRAAAR